MEFLRRIIKQIQTNLGGLNLGSKLFIGSLFVILSAAIYMMVVWSSQREMVPLLNQDLTESEIGRIENQLVGWNEPCRIQGNRILVRKTHQRALISRLGYANVLPEDTSVGWSYLLDDSNIWTPESVRENKNLVVLQMMLAKSIQDGWPEVEKAEVFINKGSRRVLSNVQPEASASVMVHTKPGMTFTRKQAASIAAFVSSANNRMKRENVKVIADGRLISVAAEGEEFSSDYIELKKQYEQEYRDKILAVLPVSNALVQVDVTPQITSMRKHEKKYNPEGEGSWNAPVEETGREDASENVQTQKEPGLMANATDTPGAGSGTSQKQTSEETSRTNSPYAGFTEETSETARGGIKDLTATVCIPSSYFEQMAQQGSQEKPTAEAVKAVKDQELPKIKRIVMRAVGLSGTEFEDRVAVEDYWAAGVAAADGSGSGGGGESAEAGVGSFAGIARQYGKQIAISALAMISLMMVLLMVRKSSQSVEVSEEDAAVMMGKKPMSALSVEDSNMVAGDGSGLLTGLEMGEEAIRSQQVMEQIKEMVSESPETAAKLITKWIQED